MSDVDVPFMDTEYGFTWGPATVERLISVQGHVVITVRTDRGSLDIRVTPSGMIRTVATKQKRGRP